MGLAIVDYIQEGIDTLLNGEENDKKKLAALKELDAFLKSYVIDNSIPEKPVLDDVPKLEKMTYDELTDDEINKNATDNLQEFKNVTLKSIDNQVENLKKQYETEKIVADKVLEKNNKAVEEAYSSAKENTDNDLLKRGIARSSIAANKSAELEGAAADRKAELFDKYSAEVAALDGEISGLEKKRSKALDDFNISYAAKLTKSINDLKEERVDKRAEVIKYNNTITEKQSKAETDKTMKESELYSELLSQREKENLIKSNADRGEREKLTYNKMADILRGLNKFDARKLLIENDVFKVNVTPKYYYALLDEFAR